MKTVAKPPSAQATPHLGTARVADDPSSRKRGGRPQATVAKPDRAATVRRPVNLPIATAINLGDDKQWRRGAAKAEAKRKNLNTTDRIVELVGQLDQRLAAGEHPFGTYLDALGECPPPAGAIYDFDQVWRNRFNWPEAGRKRIERFGCQLNWMRADESPGYWNANKNNLPFAQEFAVLSHIDEDWIQSRCDCGLFTKIFHGNRVDACWDKDWCRKCNWNGRIEPKQRSYSPDTWLKGGNWYGYTISYETDPARARAIGRVIADDDYRPDNPGSIIYGASFVPPNWNVWGPPGLARATPAFVAEHNPEVDDGALRERVQYASRRFLGACQNAIGALVRQRILDGAEQNCEVALGFMPFRMRWHIHGIGVSRDNDDPQAIADGIKEEADARLAEIATAAGPWEWPLNQRLYTNVMVVKFVEHEQLLSWIAYMHKTVNYWEPIRDAYLRPENLRPDGRLHPRVQDLLLKEVCAMRSWIDETFSTRGLTLSKDDRTRRLRRSFVWGNLKFGDSNYFIRSETKWERERRHSRAEQQRERRAARKERDRLARRLDEREGL